MKSHSFDYEAALSRLPRWIVLLTIVGLPFALGFGGVESGTGFLGGALLGYLNFRIVERAVNRLARLAIGDSKPGGGTGVWVFIQFAALALLAFVIVKVSGINLYAALWGFFVCPGAVLVEILYELITYGNT